VINAGRTLNLIARNAIGTNAAQTAPLANRSSGVVLLGDANTVGDAQNAFLGNNISGNGANGVAITGIGNLVAGNWIGVAADGDTPLGNGGNGVIIAHGATNNVIGGLSNNVISANGQDGVLITDSVTKDNTVLGNEIGVDWTGRFADGNGGAGVDIAGAADNTIGGAQAAVTFSMRNVISANGGNGITITNDADDTASSGNVISGNYIGTNLTGTAIVDSLGHSLGNAHDGVFVDNGRANTIGADMDANSDAVNVISGNGEDGVHCSVNAQQNNVLGNYVGTDVNGAQALPNWNGMEVAGTSNIIGDFISNGRNLVSGNTATGIAVYGSSIKVLYNWVGITRAGNVGLGNRADGILLCGAEAATVTANVIANNGLAGAGYAGLDIEASNNAVVSGNYIGLGANGTTVLGNQGSGIYINSSSGDVIGGAGANVNYIAATTQPSPGVAGYGIVLTASATRNTLNDNYVGFEADPNKTAAPNAGGGVDDESGGANTNNIPAGHSQ
jgi:hypothetical protein